MTETRKITRGTLFYDGTCRFCCDGVRRFRTMLDGIGVKVRPFKNGATEPEMKLHWADGTVRGGADVAFFLARRVWWLAPLGWLEWLPGCHWIASCLYREVAARRQCLGPSGECRI